MILLSLVTTGAYISTLLPLYSAFQLWASHSSFSSLFCCYFVSYTIHLGFSFPSLHSSQLLCDLLFSIDSPHIHCFVQKRAALQKQQPFLETLKIILIEKREPFQERIYNLFPIPNQGPGFTMKSFFFICKFVDWFFDIHLIGFNSFIKHMRN